MTAFNELTDKQLEKMIESLKSTIQSWATKHKLWQDAGFRSFDEHFDDKPWDDPCVLVMWFDGLLFDLFNGYDENTKLRDDFYDLMQKTDFWYSLYDSTTMIFVARDDILAEKYKRYFEFQWICKLVTPDFSDIYQELFTYFAHHPDKYYQLKPREFEYFLESVFRNHGYRTEIGPGWADGGVDLRLYQNDVVGEIVTLVQAKRYKANRSIKLDVVQALKAIVDDQNAHRGLLVTTSRFLPSTKNFAAKHSHKLKLATSQDIMEWCRQISESLQKYSPIDLANEVIQNPLPNSEIDTLVGKIVHATWGYNMVINDFCLIIKESSKAVLLVKLTTVPVKDDGYGQEGYEVPVLPLKFESAKDDEIIRAQKRYSVDGKLYFWGDLKYFKIWDGEPKYFTYLD